MNRTMIVIGLAALLGTLSAVGSHEAGAQYPPPTGNLTLRAATTAPPLSSVLGISATARDQTGAAVAGISCTFQIISQPGADATVDGGPFVTDANGVASTTLDVGNTPGNIVVGANCGDLTSQVLVAAGGGAPAPALPATGQGPDGSAKTGWLVWVLVAGLGALALATALRRTLGRRTR